VQDWCEVSFLICGNCVRVGDGRALGRCRLAATRTIIESASSRMELGIMKLMVKKTRKQKGFSLIELLIVVAIILIIASIAIPNLLRARMSANEASAVGAIRTVNTAQISYNSAYPTTGYAATLAALGGTACAPPSAAGACLIDSGLASGTKNGYVYTLTATGTPAAAYQIIAAPTVPNQTGTRYFCSFSDAVVRSSESAIATCDGSITPMQ
jgi:type IV pilus assembly protein PilA